MRYKWLLALRILFLLSLILAFAQPFFLSKQTGKTTNRLQVIYIDNSSSMSVKKGARNLLDIVRDAAHRQLQQAPNDTRFILLTNDKPVSYHPISSAQAIAALSDIEISSSSKNATQIFATIQGLAQSEAVEGADVYYYSDFQHHNFPALIDKSLTEHIHFYGVPVRAEAVSNIFIDTAFLTSPVLQTGQSNRMIVKTKLTGKKPDEAPVLQLSINGQIKSATTITFNKGNEKDEEHESIDTLSFQVNNSGWQKIMLTVNDAAIRYDDTFRITARSASNLSVLVLNERQPNPYIQAAFRAYNGFKMDQKNIGEHADWKQYNLIIINEVTKINEVLAQQIFNALQQGQSICIFPGKTSDINFLNEGLQKVGDIKITGLDTTVQAATNLQQGSDLVRDLFEHVPENVQLPVANWHYNISAGLSANQQSILSFRNGDPLLAQYTPSRGKLYLSSASADLQSGNLPGSYFFVPFLYQMTAQSKGSDVYAVTAGKQQPVFLSLNNANERNMVHVYADGIDVIPPQRPSGAGLDVFLAQAIQQPGFYTLAAAAASDSTMVALNQDRIESQSTLWDLNKLQSTWKGNNIHWEKISAPISDNQWRGTFPLWKVCVILALITLAAESYLLAAGFRKPTLASR